MAYTIWGAINAFRENTVDLATNDSESARRSRDYLYDQLKNLSDGNKAFPTISKSFIPFGSFARKTKIRPLDDIDFLMLLSSGETAEEQGNSAYERRLRLKNDSSPLARFADDPAYYGGPRYINSIRVLNAVKSGLSSISNYGAAEVRRNQQAVILNLKSYTWSFDIVPAAAVSGWNGDVTHYLIPNGSGHWMQTDPRKDQASISSANSKHNLMFLPTVRLLKYWNVNRPQVTLPSYYFETLCLKVYQYTAGIDEYPIAVKYFFDNASSYLWQNCPDPKGLGPNLDADIDYATKQKVNEAIKMTATNAGLAIHYAARKDEKTAMEYWQKVFGSSFPSYG